MKKGIVFIMFSLCINVPLFSQEVCSIEDLVEFQNLMEGCSGLTNQAKSNYEKARPSIEGIAQRNGFTMYEYHYVNGNLGQGEMSSYCCFLYKNCKISKDEHSYPTFTPTKSGVSCVIDKGYIQVYNKNTFNELVQKIKERCGNKVYSYTEDEEEIHYYYDGKYCFWINYGYTIGIRKKQYFM